MDSEKSSVDSEPLTEKVIFELWLEGSKGVKLADIQGSVFPVETVASAKILGHECACCVWGKVRTIWIGLSETGMRSWLLGQRNNIRPDHRGPCGYSNNCGVYSRWYEMLFKHFEQRNGTETHFFMGSIWLL